MKDGLILLGAGVPAVCVADVRANTESILEVIRDAARRGTAVLALPELCVTGYTCGDLFFQHTLLDAAAEALGAIAEATRGISMLTFVGVPLAHGGKLYNCAAAISDGEILGVIPKTYLPDYGEFAEPRWFTAAPLENGVVRVGGRDVPFGTKLVFSCREMPALTVGCEICEDLWALSPPSVALAAAGATVIVNLSASDEIVGKAEFRRDMTVMQSAKLHCAYVFSSAGEGESATDLVFAGHGIVAEGGEILAENPPFGGGRCTVAAADLFHLISDRMRTNTFPVRIDGYTTVPFSLAVRETPLPQPVRKNPFVPEDADARARRCREILEIQSRALASRLTAAHAGGAVVAVSGGLDSCLALLVAVRAFEILGRDPAGIRTVTMPCYGTTARTRSNAQVLSEALGTTFREIDITEAVAVHFRDIGHDPEDRSVVYENAQARERTQIVMDMANADGSLVVGTGDLSELALGWATYNGDHMSSYAVNADVPKTLVRCIVDVCARDARAKGNEVLADVLSDILDTPVSPELLPCEDGKTSQRTEDIVGPYKLHDFFLYRMIRYGENPSKIFRMASAAFDGVYDRAVILKWLKTFLRRFFAQQFKRSCLPDGPKVGVVGFSPRGDFHMPSDAHADAWLAECDRIKL